MLEPARHDERLIDGGQVVPGLVEYGTNSVDIPQRGKELQRARKQSFSPKELQQPSRARLEQALAYLAQFIEAGSGGPAQYEGRTMEEAHYGMNISVEEYMAAIQDVMNALSSHGKDDETKRDVRARVECMWRTYRQYCPDEHFLMDARTHFVAHTWEMYLATALLKGGVRLRKPPRKGPDILIDVAPRRIWIEAIAMEPGDGDDAVPGRDRRGSADART